MRVRIECYRRYFFDVYVLAVHNGFVSSYVYHFAYNAAAVFIVLVFYELTFKADREFGHYWRINVFRSHSGKSARSKFAVGVVAGNDAEIISLGNVRRIGYADRKGTLSLYILDRLV